MRFVCDSCRAQYMISDEKVGAKGVKVRCKKCGFVILVRKTQEAAAPPPPPPPDEGSDATQVMQMPLGGGLGDADQNTYPGVASPADGAPASNGFLAGMADDEIGAVFDQVLSSGSQPVVSRGSEEEGEQDEGGTGLGDASDDRMSTRVLDAETVRKLAEEAAGDGTPTSGNHLNGKSKAAAAEPAEKHDWFVAIDEKQVGPLTLEKIKEHWDEGEIGADSLCWRAGFSDWVPVSEVEELASVLAPQPKKPVIVGSSMEPSGGAMVSVPVESAFSAGGMSRTVRSEMSVMTSTPSTEGQGGWKPSGASALASLVKEEIEALARPPEAKKQVEYEAPGEGSKREAMGLLDLPSTEHPLPSSARVKEPSSEREQAPRDSRSGREAPLGATGPDAPSYSSSAYRPGYRQQSGGGGGGLSRGVMIAGGVGLGLLVVLVGAVVFLAVTGRSGPSAAEPVALAPVPVPAPTAVQPPAPAAAVKAPEEAPVKQEEEKVAVAPKEEVEKSPSAVRPAAGTASRTSTAARGSSPAPAPTPAPSPSPGRAPAGDSDDFDSLFGSKPPTAAKKPESGTKSTQSVYVPPAPGSATIPQNLGQSDIMQVVLSQKGAIQKCVNEQKEKDPGTSGKLVMRWRIQTSGRTANISVQSGEFKSTHVAACLSGLIKNWKFPAHQVAGEPIDFPFIF